MSEGGDALRGLALAPIGNNARRVAEMIIAENLEDRAPTGAQIRELFGWSKHAASRAILELLEAGLVDRPTRRAGLHWVRSSGTPRLQDEPEGHEVAVERDFAVAERARSSGTPRLQGRSSGTPRLQAQRETIGSSTTVGLSGHEVAVERDFEEEPQQDQKETYGSNAPIDSARARKMLNDQGFPWQKILMGSTGRMIREWIERQATEAEVRHGIALAHESNRGVPDSPRYYQWAVREAIERSRTPQKNAPDGAGAQGAGEGSRRDERGRSRQPEIIHGLDDKDYGASQIPEWLRRGSG